MVIENIVESEANAHAQVLYPYSDWSGSKLLAKAILHPNGTSKNKYLYSLAVG